MTPYAYFLDVDGTLLDLARRPNDVRVAPDLLGHLERLARRSNGAVAIVSGRPLADLDRLFPGVRLQMAGQHGLERRSAAGRAWRVTIPSARLDGARRSLTRLRRRHPALLIEDKGLSLAVHYRRAPHLRAAVLSAMERARARLGSEFTILRGKCVVELKPAHGDKGTAVAAFMRQRPFRGRRPVFIGDDATDEPGFAAAEADGGIGLKVGPGPTVARWRVATSTAIRAWLRTAALLPPKRAVRRTMPK